MSAREYTAFAKSGNNAIQVYCDLVRNLSTEAQDIATSIRIFFVSFDCAQYSPMSELVNALEDLLPCLHERADCYRLRAERIDDILANYSVNYTVSRTTYEFLKEKMLARDSAYSPSIRNETERELSTIMVAIKSFYDLAAGVDEFERQLYNELGKMLSMDGDLSGNILLKELLVEPFYHRKPNADCNARIIKAQIHWRTYLQDHILCEARKQNEVLKMVRIFKRILHNISEENSNFLQCARYNHASFDIGITRLSTFEDLFWNYRRNGQLSIWNSLYFPYTEDIAEQYILENGLEQAWYASSPLFLYELNEQYAEDNLWIISDDLRKIAYLLTLSYRCQSRIDCYEFYMSNLGESPTHPDRFDNYLTAAVKILMVAKLIQDSIGAYSLRADCPDFLKKNDDINIIDTLPDSIVKLNPDEWNDFEEIGEFTTYLIDVLCSSNGSFRSSIDTTFGLFPYSEENVQRNTDDVVLLNCFIGYISLKLLDYANYPYRNEGYTALSKTFEQIGKDLKEICISIEAETEALYKAIFSVAREMQYKDPEILQYFVYEYPFTAESLSWRHGEGMKPLPISNIHINWYDESAYHISSISKYGGMTDYYNGRHMQISWKSFSGGWV